MNSSNVNEILNTICDKLGTTIDYIVPELIKYKRAEALATVIISGILLSAFILLIKKILKAFRKEDYEDDGFYEFTGIVLLGIGITVAVSIFLYGLYNLIIWCLGPYGAVVDYILKTIGS